MFLPVDSIKILYKLFFSDTTVMLLNLHNQGKPPREAVELRKKRVLIAVLIAIIGIGIGTGILGFLVLRLRIALEVVYRDRAVEIWSSLATTMNDVNVKATKVPVVFFNFGEYISPIITSWEIEIPKWKTLIVSNL